MCVPGGFCICGGKEPPPVSQRLTAPASGGRVTMKVEPIGVDQARATGSTGTPGFIVEVMVTFVM